MPAAKNSTTLWSSRPAFYLATIGAAVGLGSIWHLPYLVGASGGSAFVFVFTGRLPDDSDAAAGGRVHYWPLRTS
jgi:SNF family Na+-dependent transporter